MAAWTLTAIYSTSHPCFQGIKKRKKEGRKDRGRKIALLDCHPYKAPAPLWSKSDMTAESNQELVKKNLCMSPWFLLATSRINNLYLQWVAEKSSDVSATQHCRVQTEWRSRHHWRPLTRTPPPKSKDREKSICFLSPSGSCWPSIARARTKTWTCSAGRVLLLEGDTTAWSMTGWDGSSLNAEQWPLCLCRNAAARTENGVCVEPRTKTRKTEKKNQKYLYAAN